MADETKLECPCTKEGCANNSKCEPCVARHVGMGNFPACFFSAEAEKLYDRSFEALVKDRT